MAPALSVVVPCFNAQGTIEGCLRSILRSRYRDFEMVVVDDGSDETDATAAIVKSLRDQDARVRYFRLPANRGAAEARNVGAAQAEGEFVLFIDSDAQVLPDTLQNFMARIQECDAVTGIYHAESLTACWAGRYKALLNHYFFSQSGVVEYSLFGGAIAGMRAAVFREIGGYDSAKVGKLEYEHEELSERLTPRYRNILDPSVQVRHAFPGWRRLTRNYWVRSALWAELSLRHHRLENV